MLTSRTQRICLSIILWCVVATCAGAGTRGFVNPYAPVKWDSVEYYNANLHTHTVYSDGDFAPHEAIDRYEKLGYRILALTDHDNDYYDVRPHILYPWTGLGNIYNEIKDKRNPSWRWTNETFATISKAWENRDPVELNMVSISGTEVSRTHHIGSLLNDYAGNTTSEETALVEIGKRDGLAIFLHPGRHDPYVAWYLWFYRRHRHLIGMEVFNQKDRYPGDRAFWDSVLYRLMPDRPVWGFAGDDMHQDEHLGWNFTVFPLGEMNQAAIRAAMESGSFYFYKPNVQKTPPVLRITSVEAQGDSIRLAVEGKVETIRWITYNPETRQSEVIHQGGQISLSDVPSSATFVRAEIVSPEGTAYTQPFGIQNGDLRKEAETADGDMQDVTGWSIHQDKGSTLTLDSAEGKSGKALKATYDLTAGEWTTFVKTAGSISTQAVIRFDVKGEGHSNSIQLKLEDATGATYGVFLPMKTDDNAWTRMEVCVTELKYWWGAKKELDTSNVGLSFAVVKRGGDEGGTGALYLNNISIR